MIWQDILFAVGGFGFSVALLPSVFGDGKPAKSSCAITGGILMFFAVGYATLGLWWAAGSTALTCVVWAVLYLQQLRGKKR